MTKGERYAAIKQVEKWISEGFSRSSLRVMIGKAYGLKSRSAQNKLISDAAFELATDIDKDEIRSISLQRLDSIYEKTFKADGDSRTAIRALEVTAKIAGLLDDRKEAKIQDGEKVYELKF